MHEMHNSTTQLIIGLSRVIQNILNWINLSIFGWPLLLSYLKGNKIFDVFVSKENSSFLKMHSLFNVNPTDYELQIKETGVLSDQ